MVLLCGHIDTGTPTTVFPAKDLNEFMTAGKHATSYTTHELLLVMANKLGQLKTQRILTTMSPMKCCGVTKYEVDFQQKKLFLTSCNTGSSLLITFAGPF